MNMFFVMDGVIYKLSFTRACGSFIDPKPN